MPRPPRGPASRDTVRMLGAGHAVRVETGAMLEQAALSEKRWMAQVIRLAKAFGWGAYHTWDSRNSAAGFPDLVLVRRPRVVFAELKTNRGLVSDAQQAWIDELQASGQEVYVWRPNDLDHVTEVLKR